MEKHKKQIVHRHMFEDATMSWVAPEYAHHEKSLTWFVGAALIILGLVIYGLMTNGWTFSIAVLVFAGTYYLIYRTPPQHVEVKISRAGVKIGRHIFSYAELRGFWIVYNPPFVSRLYIRMQTRLRPDVCIDLVDMDVSEVKRELLEHMHEIKGVDEPFADTVIRLLRL
ncbi:hypothetical protein KBD59_03145 [Candidatus Gracilibacteria bacterium]|nr:hypothetical protein [Candidatus Gracilibacteria bacterium]